MATTFHDLSVRCYLQALTGVEGFLAKGLSHCQAHGIDPGEIIETRLYADMFPFSFQLWSVAHHSLGAIRGIEAGVFTPPAPIPTLDYAGWQNVVSDARETLAAMTPEAVNALEDRTFCSSSAISSCRSSLRTSCCRSRCRTCIFTRRRRTTSCG
jgi:hypothetical protein